MKRRAVDTAFAAVFIFIIVVMVYPTSYMFLHGLLGPRPPLPAEDAALLLEAEDEAPPTREDALLFLGFTWAWFAAGAILPAGLAYAAYLWALRIFRQANPRALAFAAFLSVWCLYGAVTLFAWLKAGALS
jgi:hypothetical protein